MWTVSVSSIYIVVTFAISGRAFFSTLRLTNHQAIEESPVHFLGVSTEWGGGGGGIVHMYVVHRCVCV